MLQQLLSAAIPSVAKVLGMDGGSSSGGVPALPSVASMVSGAKQEKAGGGILSGLLSGFMNGDDGSSSMTANAGSSAGAAGALSGQLSKMEEENERRRREAELLARQAREARGA